MSTKSVIIVDDEKQILEILSEELESTNQFKYIISASDGQDALLKFDRQKFDLAIVDINMPKVNGLDFIDKVKNHKDRTKRDVEIIVISGALDSEHITAATKLGITNFLVKPYKSEELIKKITTITKKTNG